MPPKKLPTGQQTWEPHLPTPSLPPTLRLLSGGSVPVPAELPVAVLPPAIIPAVAQIQPAGAAALFHPPDIAPMNYIHMATPGNTLPASTNT